MRARLHATLAERQARGEQARDRVPPSSHAGWEPPVDRFDPVALIEDQNAHREPDLVPMRHARMSASPFTFYRGTAAIMAADLATTPRSGLDVQLCGDAHLSNFGVFASPERRLVFDINDFDETLPGPFEYDVKRLAASVFVAARNNGFRKSEAREATKACVHAYQRSMREFATMGTLEVWYAHFSEDLVDEAVGLLTADLPKGKARAKIAKQLTKGAKKTLKKARRRDSLQALSKLAEVVDGRYRIVSDPPTIIPARELQLAGDDSVEEVLGVQFARYRASLAPHHRELVDRYEVVDWARKVVGVGSVGTRAFIGLLQGRDDQDPLFLQAKEATASVLEGHLRKSRFRQPGERVVHGQRMMQASSDIFLGATRGHESDRFFYWRQLRDMKQSVVVETMKPSGLNYYGRMLGWCLARAHARSGDPVAIASYLGEGEDFEVAVTDFAKRYAEQNDRDFAAFTDAIGTSRLLTAE